MFQLIFFNTAGCLLDDDLDVFIILTVVLAWCNSIGTGYPLKDEGACKVQFAAAVKLKAPSSFREGKAETRRPLFHI